MLRQVWYRVHVVSKMLIKHIEKQPKNCNTYFCFLSNKIYFFEFHIFFHFYVFSWQHAAFALEELDRFETSRTVGAASAQRQRLHRHVAQSRVRRRRVDWRRAKGFRARTGAETFDEGVGQAGVWTRTERVSNLDSSVRGKRSRRARHSSW